MLFSTISVAGNRRIRDTGVAAGFVCLLLFVGTVAQIEVIDDIQKRRDLAAVLIVAVDVVGNGDKANMILREEDFRIIPGLQILSPDAGHILDDDRADLAGFDIGYKPIPRRTIEISAAPPIVYVNAVFDTREIPNKQGLSAVLLRRKPSLFMSVFCFSATLPVRI